MQINPKNDITGLSSFIMKISSAQNGNILIIILVAVILFAALTAAVTQGERSGADNLTSEKTRLLADEIIDYSNSITTATAQLRLRGVSLVNIRFSDYNLNVGNYGTFNSNPTHEIFNPNGGGVHYADPSDEILVNTGQKWQFVANNRVHHIGKDCNAASCSELLMVLAGVKKDICVAINDKLSVTNPSGNPPIDNDMNLTAYFNGIMGYSGAIGEDSGSSLANNPAACLYDDGDDLYIYYQVLQSQ
jgi:hypothetical protein